MVDLIAGVLEGGVAVRKLTLRPHVPLHNLTERILFLPKRRLQVGNAFLGFLQVSLRGLKSLQLPPEALELFRISLRGPFKLVNVGGGQFHPLLVHAVQLSAFVTEFVLSLSP